MKTIIKIGDNPSNKIINYKTEYLDDYDVEIMKMQGLLLSEKNITILDCTQFLVYTANSMILNSIIQKNKDLPNDLKGEPKLNPVNIKVIEIDNEGNEKCIQDNEGLIGKNYFDKLMGRVMDKFYEGLNFYDAS